MTKPNDVDGGRGLSRLFLIRQSSVRVLFVEFVDAPAFHSQTAAEFLDNLDYHDDIVDAIRREVFGGDPDGQLYQHQAETIKAIEIEPGDNVLAVPTASGKTESFFLPILNTCLSVDKPGLKAAILLSHEDAGPDQFNRFHHIPRSHQPEPARRIESNRHLGPDTARVGSRDFEMEEGTYVRGLIDPQNPTRNCGY